MTDKPKDGPAAPSTRSATPDDGLRLLTDDHGASYLIPAWLADELRAPASVHSLLQKRVDDVLGFAGGLIDTEALVQQILRESYGRTAEDLRLYAEKITTLNAQRRLLRDTLAAIRLP